MQRFSEVSRLFSSRRERDDTVGIESSRDAQVIIETCQGYGRENSLGRQPPSRYRT
jgi:hypothetical protein